MIKSNQNVIDHWNKIADSDWYNSYRTKKAIFDIIKNPASAFHPTVFALILVPSSGDNHAVFAFHLLGAKVMSTDISERQIAHAKAIAEKNAWNIEFAVDNTMSLESVNNDAFDMVYTSNGVFVWIDDLAAMFSGIYRKLKSKGLYVFYDIHSFTRPFTDGDPADRMKLIIEKPYDQIAVGDNQFHWRIQDLLNTLIAAGFTMDHIEEMYPEFGTYWFESSGGRSGLSKEELKNLYDWKTNPLAAIPAWLSVFARKK